MAGAASMVLYLAAGAAGLPVFAPMGAPGFARLLGPTGGYLWRTRSPRSSPVLVASKRRTFVFRALAAAAAFVVIHVGGFAQLLALTGSAERAIALGAAPFLAARFVEGARRRRALHEHTARDRLTARAVLRSADGRLRAPWRLLVFGLVAVALAFVAFSIIALAVSSG